MIRRGPSIALGKVRRRRLRHLPPISIIVLFLSYLIEFFIFYNLNM